mmetsp:Transcript_114271/g.198090  ORF Transcript_114271/g.198090 Transcript_114271/m.198090 type:complete len:225 (+) Transcript_114271:1226-1900(+)
MLGNPSVRSSSVFKRPAPALCAGSLRASMPSSTPPQMLVRPRGSRLFTAATACSRPASVIAVRANTLSTFSSKATSAKRSSSFKVCTTVFTACFTMSRIVSPSSFTTPSCSYVATSPIEPEMSTTQQMSTGGLTSTSGTWMLTASFISPPSAGESSLKWHSSVSAGPVPSASAGSSSGHSSAASSAAVGVASGGAPSPSASMANTQRTDPFSQCSKAAPCSQML